MSFFELESNFLNIIYMAIYMLGVLRSLHISKNTLKSILQTELFIVITKLKNYMHYLFIILSKYPH